MHTQIIIFLPHLAWAAGFTLKEALVPFGRTIANIHSQRD